jgi:hypothetical protein
MSKSSGSTYKIYFILYLAVILELLLVIVERDDAETDLKQQKSSIEQAFITFLTGLAQPPEASTKQDILKIYADADEGSGLINLKTFSDTTYYITVRGIHDINQLTSAKLTEINFVPLSGKQSRDAQPDSVIMSMLDQSKVTLDHNMVTINYNESRVEKDGKDTVLKIPVTIKFKQSGYYRFKFSYDLDKLMFCFFDDKNKPDSIRLGNVSAPFRIVYNMEGYTKWGMKIEEGTKTYNQNKLKMIKQELDKQWNKAENVLMLQIIDSTIPEPEKPPKVQVHTP